MDTLFSALAVILAGGILPLLLYRRFNLMKASAVIAIATGSLLGLIAILPVMQDTGPPPSTWSWQQFLTLSCSIDSLSAFFLVPIFIICPLAALYGFHYMDKSEESWRVAVNYLCLSLTDRVDGAGGLRRFAHHLRPGLGADVAVLVLPRRSRIPEKGNEERRLSLFRLCPGRRHVYLRRLRSDLQRHRQLFLRSARPAALPDQDGGLPPGASRLWLEGGHLPLHIWLPHAHPAAPAISRRSCPG